MISERHRLLFDYLIIAQKATKNVNLNSVEEALAHALDELISIEIILQNKRLVEIDEIKKDRDKTFMCDILI